MISCRCWNNADRGGGLRFEQLVGAKINGAKWMMVMAKRGAGSLASSTRMRKADWDCDREVERVEDSM